MARRNGHGRWNCAIPLSNASSPTFSIASPRRDSTPEPRRDRKRIATSRTVRPLSRGRFLTGAMAVLGLDACAWHVDLQAGCRHPDSVTCKPTRGRVLRMTSGRLSGCASVATGGRRWGHPDREHDAVVCGFPAGSGAVRAIRPWRVPEQSSNKCCLRNDDSG